MMSAVDKGAACAMGGLVGHPLFTDVRLLFVGSSLVSVLFCLSSL